MCYFQCKGKIIAKLIYWNRGMIERCKRRTNVVDQEDQVSRNFFETLINFLVFSRNYKMENNFKAENSKS